MNHPIVSKIRIYPVKSLDAIELTETEIGIHSLLHDRTYAMRAEDGKFINGKRTGKVNQLKTDFDLANGLIHFTPRTTSKKETFELKEGNAALNEYLGDYFGMKLEFLHNTNGDFMDAPKKGSVSILSEASLESLRTDFTQYSMEDLRLRFRVNIELTGVDAYWEENLFHKPGTAVKFTMGDVEMTGISPRIRCSVPPRNPWTGEKDKSFMKTMKESRAKNLPANSTLPEFGNMYHLAVDAYIPITEVGKIIKIGDAVKIGETVDFDKKQLK
jgi:uncharacterized protein YcbX